MIKFLFIICALLSSSVFAQMNYGDRRLRADTDPRTLEARKEFNSSMRRHFRNVSRIHKLEDIDLRLNSRLVSQYGRGKASALAVIPREIDQVMEFISEAKYGPYDLVDCLKSEGLFRSISEEKLLKAVRLLGETKKLRMEYWGYMVQTEMPPEYDAGDNELTYRAHWHEADSYYELYDKRTMRKNIIKALLKELDREWYEFW